jgi:hypothetical protein
VNLGKEEVAESKRAMDTLNELIYKVANGIGFEFIDLRKPFEGRGCGSPDPLINCIVRTSENGTDIRQSFHPNGKGDAVIANLLLSHPKIQDLADENGDPLPNALAPADAPAIDSEGDDSAVAPERADRSQSRGGADAAAPASDSGCPGGVRLGVLLYAWTLLLAGWSML